MSYDEYVAWADEDTHAEWVNGEVIVPIPPKPRHQEVIGFLLVFLNLFTRLFQLGKAFTAPLEMRAIPDGPARQPDLLFVAQAHLERLTESRLSGPADLVVEVVSDDSVSRDRTEKFYEYQEAGIPEYWIVDPRPGRQRIDMYILDATQRYRAVSGDALGRYHATVLPGLWLREDWFLATELPDPLQALAQLVGPTQLLEALGLSDPTLPSL
jgi:Uma2 family endonuclease